MICVGTLLTPSYDKFTLYSKFGRQFPLSVHELISCSTSNSLIPMHVSAQFFGFQLHLYCIHSSVSKEINSSSIGMQHIPKELIILFCLCTANQLMDCACCDLRTCHSDTLPFILTRFQLATIHLSLLFQTLGHWRTWTRSGMIWIWMVAT